MNIKWFHTVLLLGLLWVSGGCDKDRSNPPDNPPDPPPKIPYGRKTWRSPSSVQVAESVRSSISLTTPQPPR